MLHAKGDFQSNFHATVQSSSRKKKKGSAEQPAKHGWKDSMSAALPSHCHERRTCIHCASVLHSLSSHEMMVHAVSVAQPDLPCDVMHTVYVAYLLHLSVEQPELTRL